MKQKGIISFSLWGNNNTYNFGAVRNANLVKEVYPNCDTVFFVGENVDSSIIKLLVKSKAIVIIMNEPCDWRGMLWRFRAIEMFMSRYDFMLSRDCDSRVSHAEAKEVEEWLNASFKDESNKSFPIHSIIAHPYHNLAILGGMWGINLKNSSICSIFIDQLQRFDSENKYQTDQDFLNYKILPICDFLFSRSQYLYTSNMLTKEKISKDFSFIGEPVDMFDQPLDATHREILKKHYQNL